MTGSHSEHDKRAAQAAMVTDLVHYSVGAALLLWRRDKHPLRGRSMFLVVASAISIMLRNISVAALIAFEDSLGDCSPLDLLSDACIFYGIFAVFLRVWRLWFMYYSAVEKLDREKWRVELQALEPSFNSISSFGKNINEPSRWFKQHRHLVRQRFLGRCLVAGGGTYSIIACIMFFAPSNRLEPMPNPWFKNSAHCHAVQMNNILIVLISGLIVVLMIFTAFKLRKVRDNFSLKVEFKLIAVWGIIFGARGLLSIAGLVANVYLVMLFPVITVDFPILLSFWHEQKERQKSSGRNSLPRLFEVLTNDEHSELRDDYKDQLIREFAVENYLFFDETLKFKEKYGFFEDPTAASEDPQMETLRTDVRRIYWDYVADESPNQVNLSHKNRSSIESRLRSFLPEFEMELTRRKRHSESRRRRHGRNNNPWSISKATAAKMVAAHGNALHHARSKLTPSNSNAKYTPSSSRANLNIHSSKCIEISNYVVPIKHGVVNKVTTNQDNENKRNSGNTFPLHSVPKPGDSSGNTFPFRGTVSIDVDTVPPDSDTTPPDSDTTPPDSDTAPPDSDTTKASLADHTDSKDSSNHQTHSSSSNIENNDATVTETSISAIINIAELSDMFDEANAEILDLMERDSFRLWKRKYAKRHKK